MNCSIFSRRIVRMDAPVVPYLVFLVRPDGIRPYYEARSRLEPLGIAFGYELIEQDLSVDIPDFDNLTTWDGSVPLEMPLERAPQPKSNVAMLSTARPGTSGTSTGSSNWAEGDHSSPGGSGWGSSKPRGQAGASSANPDSSTPDDFVWPSRGRQSGAAQTAGCGFARDGFARRHSNWNRVRLLRDHSRYRSTRESGRSRLRFVVIRRVHRLGPRRVSANRASSRT